MHGLKHEHITVSVGNFDDIFLPAKWLMFFFFTKTLPEDLLRLISKKRPRAVVETVECEEVRFPTECWRESTLVDLIGVSGSTRKSQTTPIKPQGRNVRQTTTAVSDFFLLKRKGRGRKGQGKGMRNGTRRPMWSSGGRAYKISTKLTNWLVMLPVPSSVVGDLVWFALWETKEVR